MMGNRTRGAWVWLTVVAITFASLARAQSGMENARTYAAPFVNFFAGSHLAKSGTSAPARRATLTSPVTGPGIALEMLPVFFVGLVAPLNPLSARSAPCLGRTLPAPNLPELLQRPPPILLS